MKKDNNLIKLTIRDTKTKLAYELNLKRKTTVITGDSGSGKSFLAELINKGNRENVIVECKRDVFAPNHIFSVDFLRYEFDNSILIIDEETRFGKDNKLLFNLQDILSKMLKLNIYFIFITREMSSVNNILYSPKEVYKLERISKHKNILKQFYDFTQMRKKDFTKAICEDKKDSCSHYLWNKFIDTNAAGGNGSFHKNEDIEKNKNKLHFIDLANYRYFDDLLPFAEDGDIGIADIECFEWVVLQSTMFDKYRDRIEDMQRANSPKFKTHEKFYKEILDEIIFENTNSSYDSTSDKNNCVLDNCKGCNKHKCRLYYNKLDKCDDMIRNAGLDYLLENKYRRAMLSEVDSINTNT